jgi:ribosomal protein S18 acetylase RimI-like enzyme
MHALDNVIWNALSTRDAEFAESFQSARRFLPDVSPLAAFREPSLSGYSSLGGLLPVGGTVALFLAGPYEERAGWGLIAKAPLLQMLCEDGNGALSSSITSEVALEKLGAGDSEEMIALTALTKPGPFNNRTHELGTYLGIRRNGRLVAMAGERLKVPGYTEVSAVCTHPEHVGRGYARILMTELMRSIRERGERSFLHVREDNVGAIGLYEKLGFRRRARVHLAVLRKEPS